MRALPFPFLRARRVGPAMLSLAVVTAVAAALAWPRDAPVSPDTRAFVTVRTLVIDAMGTRTVDTASARVPFGVKGLLIRSVPYAGPPISYRLIVLPGTPRPDGIPLAVAARAWSGEPVDIPRADGSARLEETTLPVDSSFLLEISHDEETDRRIVLSIAARPIGEHDELPAQDPGSARPVQFLVEVTREIGDGGAEPFDSHLLTSIVGQPVTYRSEITASTQPVQDPHPGSSTPPAEQPGAEDRTVGLSITLTAEQVHRDLVTVKVDLAGADFIDSGRSRLEPIALTGLQTVRSGSRFQLSVTVPDETRPDSLKMPRGKDFQTVTYFVSVTPVLG